MIHDIEGQPRTRAEMRFAVTLIPCPGCGSVDTVEPGVEGTVNWPVYVWTCPGCRAERGYRFKVSPPLPAIDRAPELELGFGPSPIISPAALAAEVGRLLPRVPDDPRTLDPDAWRAAHDRIVRLRVCLNELAKFPGQDVAADRARVEEVRARYLADVPRYHAELRWMYPPPPAPLGAVDRDTVRAHERWLRQGCTGPGQLDVTGVDARNLPFGACDLRRSRFTGVLLEGANAESSDFGGAAWTRVYARGARLGSTKWDEARLGECELHGSWLHLARLRRIAVTGGDWDRVQLDRALLDDAVFEGVSLREARLLNVRLDGARFVDCDLRGADLSVDPGWEHLGTNAGTAFVGCDVRGVNVSGRRGLEV